MTNTKTIHIEEKIFFKLRDEANKRTKETGKHVTIRMVAEEKLK